MSTHRHALLFMALIVFDAVFVTLFLFSQSFFSVPWGTVRQTHSCLSLPYERQQQCLDDVLRNVAKSKGIRAALDIVEPLSQEKPYMLVWSHPFAHSIGGEGIAYYEKTSQGLEAQIGQALVSCDGYGAFGCYHGVIETGLSLLPPEDRPSVIRKACMENPLIGAKQYFINQCLHWFGHGLAIFSFNTLEETLGACADLSKNFLHDDVQLCLSGVFHAGTVPGESDDEFLHNVSRVLKKDDPYYPCLEIEEKFRGHCYSHAAGRTLSNDLSLNFRTCDNIPEKDAAKKSDYVRRCYDSAANTLLARALQNPDKSREKRIEQIIQDCKGHTKEAYRRFCYGGAARYWVLRDPLLTNAGPFELCRHVEESGKSVCYGSIGFGNNENYYSQKILEEYCKQSEPGYLSACMSKIVS